MTEGRPRLAVWLFLGYSLSLLAVGGIAASALLVLSQQGLAKSNGPRTPLRRGEVAVAADMRGSGGFRLRPLALTWPLTDLVGTHADVAPHGAYARLRVEVWNDTATYHDFDTSRQRLSAGSSLYSPSAETMTIARVPLVLSVPAHAVVEVDLWFDLPIGARPDMAVLSGAEDQSGAGPGTVTTPAQPVGFGLPRLRTPS